VIVTDGENAERMPGQLVDEVVVLDAEVLAGEDDRFTTADTSAPRRGRRPSPRPSPG
jgi:hypothetical protein